MPRPFGFSVEAVSRDSGFVFDHGDPLSNQTIEERTFADIRPANDNDYRQIPLHEPAEGTTRSTWGGSLSRMRWTLACMILGLTVTSFAQSLTPKNMFWVSGYGSILFMGSQDRRTGWGLSYQRIVPLRVLNERSTPGWLVLEANYLQSKSDRFDRSLGKVGVQCLGVLAMARYEQHRGILPNFVEIGWGLQLSNHVSLDNSSVLNSTPVAGMGVFLGKGPGAVAVGLRYLHASNAGFRGNNKGQNQLHLMVGFKF